MKTKIITLPDAGKEITVKAITAVQFWDLQRKSREWKEGMGWITDPIKEQELMLEKGAELDKATLDELTIGDAGFVFNEIQELSAPSKALKGKSQEQSQSVGPKTPK